MANRNSKIIGVSFPNDIISEIEKLAPTLDAKTLAEACRKMVLAFLIFRGIKVAEELFSTRRGSRIDLSRDPIARRHQLANAKLAREALAKKRALAALEKLRSEKVSEGVPKIKIKARKAPKKRARKAA